MTAEKQLEKQPLYTDAIYQFDGKIPFRKAVPFGLQHVLAMFVANIAPILIVTGVVKMPMEQAGALVQAAMIMAGIGSLLQMFPIGPLGSRLPIIMGISFTFVSTFCVIGIKYGYGAILGAALVGDWLPAGGAVLFRLSSLPVSSRLSDFLSWGLVRIPLAGDSVILILGKLNISL